MITTLTTSETLIRELKREADGTRRVLERVPEEKLSWAPHPKSMTLGTLALHVAIIPGALSELASQPVVEMFSRVPGEARSRQEILDAFEQSLAGATARLQGWSDDDLRADWRLTRDGQTLIRTTRIEMLRAIMLNHWYHHRGQLTVYLRLLDVPVPAVYGASADENPFG